MSGDYGLCVDPDAEFAAEYPDPLSGERIGDLLCAFNDDGVVGFESAEQMHKFDDALASGPANDRELAQRRALGLEPPQPTRPVWGPPDG